MRFIDRVKVEVHGGNGGDGLVGWRREKYVPQGGPAGGDGGNGGAVILEADPETNTLIDIYYHPILNAESGEPGGANCRNGKNGEDLIVKVPLGTEVYYQEKLVADLNVAGARWVAARGAKGGRGNTAFKNSTRQAPDFAQKGLPGESWEFTFVLKSVADVGLVGLPNVGKSTLLSKLSASQPTIGNYPFTTIRPNLGVVKIPATDNTIVVADIPGLIEQAHQGKGLGIDFLRHIERTKVLLQMIDITTSLPGDEHLYDDDSTSDEDIIKSLTRQFQVIDSELKYYSEAVHKYPRIIAFSKGELKLSQRAFNLSIQYFAERNLQTTLISSHSGEGLEDLKNLLERSVHA